MFGRISSSKNLGKFAVFVNFTLLLNLCSANAAFTNKSINGQLTFFNNGHPILTYQIETASPPKGVEKHYKRSGFIHPL